MGIIVEEHFSFFGVMYRRVGWFEELYPTLYRQVVEKGAKAGETIFIQEKDGTYREFRVIRDQFPTCADDFLAPTTLLGPDNSIYRKQDSKKQVNLPNLYT